MPTMAGVALPEQMVQTETTCANQHLPIQAEKCIIRFVRKAAKCRLQALDSVLLRQCANERCGTGQKRQCNGSMSGLYVRHRTL